MILSLRCAVLTLLLSPALTSAFAQNAPLPAAPLPSAPTAPSAPSPQPLNKPNFGTPAPQYEVPKGPPLPKNEVCYGPREGGFAKSAHTGENNGLRQGYVNTIHSEIATEWDRRMPRAAKNSWARGKKLVLRFAIMPDGSHTAPELTVSSGKDVYDQAALEAVRARPLFPPLPGDQTVPLIMCMSFGYNLSQEEMNSLQEPSWEKSPQKP